MKTIKQLVKTTALIAALLIGNVGSSNAQAFDEGTNVLNAGIGIGSTLLSGAGYSQSPGIGLSFDHGMSELGNGIFGLGAYVGYKSYSYDYNDVYYGGGYNISEKWTYTIIGARGSYHFDVSNDKLDLYLGVMLSYNILSYKVTSNDPSFNSLNYNLGSYGSGVGFTGFGGVRYFLSDNIGLHAEVGYGVALLQLGASFKF